MLEFLKNAEGITFSDIPKIKSPFFKGTVKEIVKSALENNISVYKIFDKKMIFILSDGEKLVWIHKALTSKASPIGVNIARDKHLTKQFLKMIDCPVAASLVIKKEDELAEAIRKIPFPMVVKPVSSAEGSGVTINIDNFDLLRDSFLHAKKFDNDILIEKFIEGDYYRLTYIADGAYAATKNLPAYITGNGKQTARELINLENKHSKERGAKGRLKKISITEKTDRFLASCGYSLSSIIPDGEKIPLCFSGFDGGEYIDVTDKVHQYFLDLASSITEKLGLPIIGLDILSSDITKPLTENNGIVIEVNGTFPDIQFHLKPTQGKPRNLAPDLVNYLFK